MAINVTQPRTAFHKRLQSLAEGLASGGEQVTTGLGDVGSGLVAGFDKVSSHLRDLTEAVKAIPPTPGAAGQLLLVKVETLLEEGRWEAHAVPVEGTLRDGIALMRKFDVRTLLLVKGQQIVGMTTPSRLLAAALDGGLDAPLTLHMVPREAFHCVDQGRPLAEAFKLFRNYRVRRLFVTGGGRTNPVVGILTLGRCMRWLAERLLEQASAAA
jgi:CBS domain-containing protein